MSLVDLIPSSMGCEAWSHEIYFDSLSGCPRQMVKMDGKWRKLVYSIESFQDCYMKMKTMFAVRTPPITDEEIEDWNKAGKWLDKLDLEEVRSRLKIEDRHPPYEDGYYGY